MSASRLFTLPDGDLTEAGSSLTKKLEAAADAITPGELPAVLDDLMRHSIDEALTRVGADEGSVWLLDSAREALVASYNNRNPDFVGFRQELGSGIISMVVATEQSCCENDVYRHREHCGNADDQTGKLTFAMIAVPLYYGGSLRGILSCVQHKEAEADPDPPGFGPEPLFEIEHLAELLGRLIDHRLSTRLLGLEE